MQQTLGISANSEVPTSSTVQAQGARFTTVSISVGNPSKSYLIRTVILSETRSGLNG
jgi:hypothetical protein